MPFGYSPEDIAKRIKQKSGSRMYEEIAENLEKKEKLASIDEIYKNTGTYRRLYPVCRKTPCFSYGDIRHFHRIYASN